MTSVPASDIIACPSCSARYSRPRYGSINFRNWRAWSDGRASGDLYRPPDPIGMCTACDSVFLIEAADVVGRIDWHAVAQRRAASRSRKPGWLAHVFARLTGRPAPKAAPIPAPEKFPEPPKRLTPEELAASIESIDATVPPGLEIALRRQQWRLLNDPHREHVPAPAARAEAPISGEGQAANLKRLLELLHQSPTPDWLEIGELQRKLGWFEDARESFSKVPEAQSRVASFLAGLAAAGLDRVVRVDNLDNLPMALIACGPNGTALILSNLGEGDQAKG